MIYQTDTDYTIVSERDKKFHTLTKPADGIKPGPVLVEEGHLVDIQMPFFCDASRLFTACREYVYDNERKAKKDAEARKKKREEKAIQMMKVKEEREKKGIFNFGKHKGATYEDILLVDEDYCKRIMKKPDCPEMVGANPEIIKFKAWLDINFNKRNELIGE